MNGIERLKRHNVRITTANGYSLEYANIPCRVYPQERQWVFEYWECIPGPAKDDFLCYYPSLETALRAVFDFYFGTAALVDSWLVPLHKHPELSVIGVSRASSEAVNVSQEVFEGIAERRRARTYGNRLLGKTSWEWALQYQFLIIEHQNNPSLTFRLRRDMQEAYIVHAE